MIAAFQLKVTRIAPDSPETAGLFRVGGGISLPAHQDLGL
jgi:hypothetical protein